MSTPQISLTSLLQRTKEGDRQARKELFQLLGDEREFASVIFAMVRRVFAKGHPARQFMETRDVVQSVLRTGLRHFSEFRGDSEGQLFNWFRTIVRTKLNRAVRSARPEANVLDPDEIGEEKDGPTHEVAARELVGLLRDAIKKLPLHERLVVELRVRGANSVQIAEILGLKPATVRKRESRALQRIKETIDSGSTDRRQDGSSGSG